jgi:hypothetical protein
MNASRFLVLARWARVCLLLGAMVLPIAQSAATLHALSTVRPDRDSTHGRAILHHSGCDICLAAAALSGGVLPTAAALPPRTLGRHESPSSRPRQPLRAAPCCNYRSRAPPLAAH